jgi:hypothetical protein
MSNASTLISMGLIPAEHTLSAEERIVIEGLTPEEIECLLNVHNKCVAQGLSGTIITAHGVVF